MDTNIDKSFKPTIEWMASKYEEMNKRLFMGQLGMCDFGIFTNGRGSEGRTLGYFQCGARGLQAERRSRRMFISSWGNLTYINKDNFVDLCHPIIKLNGNYSGTEHVFTNVLVHEMCHYYTYMHGFLPKQAHGVDFRNIAANVAYRSNGEFSVQRLASAEDMSQLELSDEMKEKKNKRIANRKTSITVVLRFMTDGRVELTNAVSKSLIDLILGSYNRNDVKKIVTSNDENLINDIFNKGYKSTMRTWKYWTFNDRDIIENLSKYKVNETYNPKYMVDESRRKINTLIKEVIDDYISDGDIIDIPSDMNLGLHSPLEIE